MLCDCMKINIIGESTTALTILVPTQKSIKLKFFTHWDTVTFPLRHSKMVFESLHLKVMNNLSKENPLRDIIM